MLQNYQNTSGSLSWSPQRIWGLSALFWQTAPLVPLHLASWTPCNSLLLYQGHWGTSLHPHSSRSPCFQKLPTPGVPTCRSLVCSCSLSPASRLRQRRGCVPSGLQLTGSHDHCPALQHGPRTSETTGTAAKVASSSLPSDTPSFLEEDPPFTTNKWVLETRITAGQAVNSALKELQPRHPDHQDSYCRNPAKLHSFLYSLSVEMLYSSQTVFHRREKSVPWAQNPDLPTHSSERGETLWTHVLPLASRIVTAEDVSRLNFGRMQASQSESVKERN